MKAWNELGDQIAAGTAALRPLYPLFIASAALALLFCWMVATSPRRMPLHITPASPSRFFRQSVFLFSYVVGGAVIQPWHWVFDVISAFFIITLIFFFYLKDFFSSVSLHRDPDPVPDDLAPFVTIVIPAKNEATVLGRTVESISRLSYPPSKLRAIIVNDGSTDKTKEVVDGLMKEFSFLSAIHLDIGTGSKSGAMNKAYPKLDERTLIVGYLDADALIAPNALKQVVACLRDVRVAAVQAPKNINTQFVKGQLERMQYYEMLQDNTYQCLRSAHGSQPDLHGDGQFVRKDVIDRLGGGACWNDGTPTDDLDFTFRLIFYGYKVRYLSDRNAILEEPVYTWQQYYTQRERWATGGAQRLVDYMHYFWLTPWGYVDRPSILHCTSADDDDGEVFGEFDRKQAEASERTWTDWAVSVHKGQTQPLCSPLHLGILKLRVFGEHLLYLFVCVFFLNHLLFRRPQCSNPYSEILLFIWSNLVLAKTYMRQFDKSNRAKWPYKELHIVVCSFYCLPVGLCFLIAVLRFPFRGAGLTYHKSGRAGDSTTKAAQNNLQGLVFISVVFSVFTYWAIEQFAAYKSTLVMAFPFMVPLLAFILTFLCGTPVEHAPARKLSIPGN